MDVEMSLPLSQRPIPDGALGDDERTETDRSPVEKGLPLALPQRTPGEGQPQPRPAEDQDMDDEGDSPDGDSKSQGGRKHHRRGKHKGGKRHRSWKPYAKLTWEERQKLDERETRRATKRREQRFASGHPLAPYNTTQFLMDQHHPVEDGPTETGSNAGGEKDQVSNHSAQDSHGSVSDFDQDSPNEDIFYDRDFSEAYESCLTERLQNMSKEELIKEILDMEAKLEQMERRNRKISGKLTEENAPTNQNNNDITDKITDSPEKDAKQTRNSLEDLVTKLKEENERLQKENDLMKKSVSERTTEEGWHVFEYHWFSPFFIRGSAVCQQNFRTFFFVSRFVRFWSVIDYVIKLIFQWFLKDNALCGGWNQLWDGLARGSIEIRSSRGATGARAEWLNVGKNDNGNALRPKNTVIPLEIFWIAFRFLLHNSAKR